MNLKLLPFLLAASLSVAAQSPKMPFPQHVNYKTGTIKPNNVSQAEMDNATGDFYVLWRDKYVKKFNNSSSRIMCKTAAGHYTVAEGQGYGMVIVALMAGHDDKVKDTYDKLFKYYMDKRCKKRGKHLMKGAQDGIGLSSDGSSATDGDFDIAYSLLLASRQWPDDGRYLAAAKDMIADIRDYELNNKVWSILLSNFDEIDSDNHEYFATRPSDFMPSHFRSFATVVPGMQWQASINEEFQLFRSIQSAHHNDTGLLPDFIVNTDSNASAAPADFKKDEGLDCGSYNYNACRIPWRLGVDYLINGNAEDSIVLTPLNTWFKLKSNMNPDSIHAGYTLKGDCIDCVDKLHLSYVTPLAVSAMISSENQEWLNKLWAYTNRITMSSYSDEKTNGYYDNSIKLINMIIISGNYWKP